MAKRGRPTTYNKKLGTVICSRIANGESLRSICKEEGMPAMSTVMLWLLDMENKKEFSEQYEFACNARAEHMFEELLDIADDGRNDWMERETKGGEIYTVLNTEAMGRSRLRVDTRKWYLSKVLPKKFADKIDVTSDGKAIKGNSVIFTNFKQEEKEDE